MNMQTKLDSELKAISKIDGVSFGNLKDKSTWRIDFTKDATDEQKKLAYEVLENFTWSDVDEKAEARKAKIFEKKNNDLYRFGYKLHLRDNPNATFEDYCDYLDKIQID